MAIYGTLGEVDLGALDASIADTAVDVFVYDTTKDSDGGAWRKRTQSTSWYNETLNTATRGARREFPAVAVIVAESNQVTIYDGDDPDLPMWMVFPPLGYLTWSSNATPSLSSVHMLNGILVAGGTAGRSGTYSDFIKDDTRYIYSSAYYNPGDRTIAGRNVTVSAVPGGSYIAGGDGFVILNNSINDVAMTVLPNAPIDDATGLPIPTIAVANDGGVSVIKDDGTVVDLARSNYVADFVEFIEYNGIKLLCYLDNGSGVEIYSPGVFEIPNSDVDFGDVVLQRFTRNIAPVGLAALDGVPTSVSNSNIDKGNSSGLTRTYLQGTDFNSQGQSSVAYVTTSYNTGWMHGDIKGAFLSDTDTTNVTASTELVTNGTFDTNISGWSSFNSTLAFSSNQLEITRTNMWGFATQEVTMEIGKKYVLTADARTNNSSYAASIGIKGSIGNVPYITDVVSTFSTTMASISVFFTATQVTGYIHLSTGNNSGAVSHFDNVSLTEIKEEDRSVNDNGLSVYGTITKSAVTTGAELVGYSGYSSSNYLVQPNIAAPGTGDFSITVWIKPNTFNVGTGNYVHLFSLGTSSTGGQGRSTGFVLKLTTHTSGNANGYSPYFFSGDGGGNQGTYNASNYIPLGKWSQIIMMRRGGVAYVYSDGELVQTGDYWTTNLTDTYLTIFKGIGYNEYGGDAEFALLRYSLSAPSTEQIKKMYEDEKVLFQENAGCTLYGSSDAVTALAFDDSTQLLHVGTSSGRSEFKGLRRVDNTTIAVTTAISASSGLVAEQ